MVGNLRYEGLRPDPVESLVGDARWHFHFSSCNVATKRRYGRREGSDDRETLICVVRRTEVNEQDNNKTRYSTIPGNFSEVM